MPWKPNARTRSPPPSRICARAPPICGGIFDFDAKVERLEEVGRELENPTIWNDPERAQALGRERATLERARVSLLKRKDRDS